ncbi:MAG: DUF4351 domain-containing protein [Xenococcaceae cyanobacterium]
MDRPLVKLSCDCHLMQWLICQVQLIQNKCDCPGPKVKAECLRLLVTLRLDPARIQLISGFIDTYLDLSESENQVFQDELGRIEPEDREGVMQIVTSWMRTGIEQGRQEGIQEGIQRETDLVLRLLKHKLGELAPEVETQVRGLEIDQLEDLGEILLDFERVEDLTAWLKNKSTSRLQQEL